MSQTVNKFKSSSVGGTFNNVDLPNSSELSFAYFQRDIQVDGNIINLNLNNLLDSKVNTSYFDDFLTNLNTDLSSKASISYVNDEIATINDELIIKANISYVDNEITTINNELITKANISYVDEKIALLVDSSPETLDTLSELANALGDDPNFATSVATNIGLKADKIYTDTQLALKADKTYTDTQLSLKANLSLVSNVNNTSDANKPVSTFQQNALNLKANISDMNNALATKISNNANSATNAHLHFSNGGTAYNNYLHPSNFGSICVNKSGGDAELNFIQNGYIPGSTRRAFNFLLATSNGTYSELLSIKKNGDVDIIGNITSPTILEHNTRITTNTTNITTNTTNITTINNNLLLKANLDYVNEELLKKDNVIDVNNKVLNLQNQINNIEGNYNPSSDVAFQNLTVSGTITNTNLTSLIDTKADKNNTVLTGVAVIPISNTTTMYCNGQIYFHGGDLANPASRIHIASTQLMVWDNVLNEQIVYRWGPSDIVKQIFYMNGDVSIPGNILNCSTITNINNSVALKADKTYTDNQLLLKADKTYTDTQLALKADKTYTDTQLATKLNKTGDTLTNVFLNGDTYLNSIMYAPTDKGFRFYLPANGYANFSCSIGLAGYNSMLWDNVLNDQILFRWGVSRTVKHIMYPNGDMSITGNILNCPTITTINTNIGLKADITYTNAQLLLKADKSYTDAQLATKLSNNSNSSISAYLHFSNNSQPYTEYNTQNFGSISVNKMPSGHASFDFIQNGFGISNTTTNAFTFNIATSNTTFNTPFRINKGGNAFFTGNITSPTITTINSNIALKEDTTTVNTKLANYALLDSSPTFTGNVKSQIFTGGMIRNNSNATITYTSATLPSTIVHDGPIGVYVIPLMPLGTRFSVLRTTHGTMNISSSDSTVYFFNKKDSYYFTGTTAESYTNAIEMTEDSRTFILCEMYRNGNPVKVWLTESSHTYSLMHDIFNANVGVYMLDGGDYGRSNAIHHPILCSNKNYGPANSDDGYILNPGYSITVYTDVNYGGGWYTHSNTYQHTPTKPKHFIATSNNNMQSIKVFYNGKEIIVDGISN